VNREISPSLFSRIVNSIARRSIALFLRARRLIAGDMIAQLETLSTIALLDHYDRIVKQHPNPLNRCGRKVFSQADEDGITYEVINRIQIKLGVFAEFGVGNGLENNTIFLASLGWKGFWVGGEDLAFALSPVSSDRENTDFAFLKVFIDKDNILSLARRGLDSISETEVDVVSLDLDGNDIYLVEELLSGGFLPKLFIIEYNAKFVPPIRWKIQYDRVHRWAKDDYFGASLMEFNDLFEKYGYFLVCCNPATGQNAFFVHSSYREAFRDVPDDINVLWSPPRFLFGKYGHSLSAKSVALIMNNIASTRARNLA
jgi:hypothetical protein